MSFFPFLKTLRVEEINYSNDHPLTSTPIFFPVQVLSSKIFQHLLLLVTTTWWVLRYVTVCIGTVLLYCVTGSTKFEISGNYVFCARDGWGTEEVQSYDATLYIQAWVLCSNQFSRTFVMDKNNADVASPTVDRVPLKAVYSLDSMLVSVEVG